MKISNNRRRFNAMPVAALLLVCSAVLHVALSEAPNSERQTAFIMSPKAAVGERQTAFIMSPKAAVGVSSTRC